MPYKYNPFTKNLDFITSGIASGDVDWANVKNKPESYPPAQHTHSENDIIDLHARYTNEEAIDAVANALNAGDNITIDYDNANKIITLSATGGGGGTGVFNTGSIIWWPQNTPPEGYLKCDGSLISKVDYPALFDVLGYTFGQEEGTKVKLTSKHTDYSSDTGTASARTEYASNYRAWNALDEDINTSWRDISYEAVSWWQYDFNSPQKVEYLEFTISTPGGTQKGIWAFQAWTGSEWTTLAEIQIRGDTADYAANIPNENAYTTYRFYFSDPLGWPDFREINMYKIEKDENLFGLPNINTGIANVIAIIKT